MYTYREFESFCCTPDKKFNDSVVAIIRRAFPEFTNKSACIPRSLLNYRERNSQPDSTKSTLENAFDIVRSIDFDTMESQIAIYYCEKNISHHQELIKQYEIDSANAMHTLLTMLQKYNDDHPDDQLDMCLDLGEIIAQYKLKKHKMTMTPVSNKQCNPIFISQTHPTVIEQSQPSVIEQVFIAPVSSEHTNQVFNGEIEPEPREQIFISSVPTVITELVPTDVTESVPTVITESVPAVISETVPTESIDPVPTESIDPVPSVQSGQVTESEDRTRDMCRLS
jgi:hypothetical protein